MCLILMPLKRSLLLDKLALDLTSVLERKRNNKTNILKTDQYETFLYILDFDLG